MQGIDEQAGFTALISSTQDDTEKASRLEGSEFTDRASKNVFLPFWDLFSSLYAQRR